MYKFESTIVIRDGFHTPEFKSDWSQEVIKNEPMLFNCDLDSAYKLGGPITREFLFNLPNDWHKCNPVIDSRVHMLMPKWYPCIPGFHHDDVPRSQEKHGQPDYDNMTYKSEHLMGLVNGDICPTQFLLGDFEMPAVDTSKDVIYRAWDEIISGVEDKNIIDAPSGKYIQFDWQSFHAGSKANAGGWRWFIRLSRNTDRQQNATNEIRRQSQVYLEYPTMGW